MDLRRAPGCWGEVRGAHLLSGAEARSSSPMEKKKKNSTARARGHKRANTSTLYPRDTASCVSARTVHGCTVAFGSGWEGGTCWGVQRFLPTHPALQKAGSFCFFLGEVRGAHLLSGAEARSSSPVEKKKKTARHEPEDTTARTQCSLVQERKQQELVTQ